MSTSMMGVAAAEKQAELLKDKGNLYFKKERLSAAIEAYTEAITLCPTVPVYWTNRALCHRKRNEWERVESDCRKALELDKDSVKAHYMLGLALLQRKQYEQAVRQLEKALELGRGGNPGSFMVEEIWQEVAKARYTEWEQGASERLHQHKELKDLCENLLKDDHNKQVRELKKGGSTISRGTSYVEIDGVVHSYDGESGVRFSESSDIGLSHLHAMELSELNNAFDRHLLTLSEVFDKAGAPDRVAEVPDHLCCKITMDIFRDPVVTPSGVTYERAILMEHLRKVGTFDPLTRAPLVPEQVIPNLAVKEAVQAYLSEHGWAYKLS